MLYKLFKTYLRLFHDIVFYRHTYSINQGVIQKKGVLQLIVSNHQNCLNDALGILFAFYDRKVNFITRGDIFTISPLAKKFFLSIGLLPSFRLATEGAEQLERNKATFRISEQALLSGRTVVMFPEAGHQDKRWLGNFSLGYTKLAFEAAELGNFEKEIFIVPSCNHYSNYFGIQNDFMVKFGTPISLTPYYELYKTKPRTAQRQVNALVRKQIESLMLNITDLDNYDTIDFMRETFGYQYAAKMGLNPKYLPDRLEADKKMYATLEDVKSKDSQKIEKLYADAAELKSEIHKAGITERQIRSNHVAGRAALYLFGLILLLPIGVISMWPALFIYAVGMLVFKKFAKDHMFQGTFLYAISALFTIPISAIITLVVTWIYINWWSAVLYFLLTSLLLIFAWYYVQSIKVLWYDIKALCKRSKTKELRTKYAALKEKLMDIIFSSK